MRYLPPDWVLKLLNVVLLVAVLLFGIDWYVRWRIGQAVNGYHQGVIVPMTTPRPAPAPGGAPPAARP